MSIKYEYEVTAMLMYGYSNMCEMLLCLMSCAHVANCIETDALDLTIRWFVLL
jgi:hypothetical protein